MTTMEGVNINTMPGRVESFATARQLSKRRASSTKKKAPTTVSWPHLSPLPADLARAGFFYKPSSDSNDNCECFLCHVKLDGWEAGDDPIEEHLKHSPGCGWAVSASIQRKFANEEQADEDPMSPRLVEARTHTFGDSWPYETRKGWKPKVAKMVAAGWTYDPSPEYDDAVTCMYCNLSLDGWEPKDDPFVEHQKRCPECPYFSLVEEWSAAYQQAGGRKGKGRASRSSKVSRLSTQSVITVASEAPSQTSSGDIDESTRVDDSILSVATTTSTTGKARRKKAPSKVTKKGTRGKQTASAMDESVMEVDALVEAPVDIGYPTIEDAPEPPKRQTRRKVSKQEQPSSTAENNLNESQSQRPTRGRAAKVQSQPRVSEDESQLHAELRAAVDASILSMQSPQPIRGVKRTSNGVPKMPDSSIMLIEEPSDLKVEKAKPKRGRKPKKTDNDDSTQARSSDVSVVPKRVSSAPKASPKTKKGKKAAKVVEVDPQPDPEPEPTQKPTDELETLEDDDKENDDFDFAQSLMNPINPYAPIHGTPEHDPTEASPAPSTPTPARAQLSARSDRPVNMFSSAQKFRQQITPGSSPQSSDAENKPPSARPASTRPPLSVQRVPLAQGTPNRAPLLSPSKRKIGGLTSALPWSPTDLETIFFASPVKANLALQGKENALHLKGAKIDNLDGKELKEVVGKVKKVLGKEEKEMSVEEWVRWNAKVGEERLREECEGMVMKFEEEGGRALRSLEGIECA